MNWPTIEVTGWNHFADLAARLVFPYPGKVSYVFRGQADATWSLQPTLLRYLPPDVTPRQALDVESIGYNEFRAQAHLHLSPAYLPDSRSSSKVEWWALMQHYNAPTRLLDWTQSAYVAAYYAVESHWDRVGAVFVVHRHTASTNVRKSLPDGVGDAILEAPALDEAGVFFWTPSKKTDRLVAQQGHFSVSVHILGNQHDLISEACEAERAAHPGVVFFEQWLIPPPLKREFLRRLRAVNITAHSLFPGIDGLGRSLAEVARLVEPS